MSYMVFVYNYFYFLFTSCSKAILNDLNEYTPQRKQLMTYMLYVYNSFYNLIIGHTYIYIYD